MDGIHWSWGTLSLTKCLGTMHDEYYTDGSMASDGWFSAKTAPHRTSAQFWKNESLAWKTRDSFEVV